MILVAIELDAPDTMTASAVEISSVVTICLKSLVARWRQELPNRCD